MAKISGIYKITNTVTGDFYIGSSKDVKERCAAHKRKSVWKRCPNKQLYKDFQKYGLDKFEFQVIAEVEPNKLKEVEQQFIEKLHPAYNNYYANGRDIEKKKEANKKYQQSDKFKETQKKYQQSDKGKETKKKYQQSDKYKKQKKQYHNQLCLYKGEILTLCALASRFQRAGIPHQTAEAKKYLLQD